MFKLKNDHNNRTTRNEENSTTTRHQFIIYTFMPPVSQWVGRREHLQETMFVKKKSTIKPNCGKFTVTVQAKNPTVTKKNILQSFHVNNSYFNQW